MKRYAAVGVGLALALGISTADDKALKELEGNYTVVALTKAGKDAPDEVVKTATAKIAGDELTFTIKDKAHPAKVKLDPTKKPAAIDIAPAAGPDKGRTFPGIYKVEKGELVLAFTERGDRPTEFKGEGDVLLVRLKRAAAKKGE